MPWTDIQENVGTFLEGSGLWSCHRYFCYSCLCHALKLPKSAEIVPLVAKRVKIPASHWKLKVAMTGEKHALGGTEFVNTAGEYLMSWKHWRYL